MQHRVGAPPDADQLRHRAKIDQRDGEGDDGHKNGVDDEDPHQLVGKALQTQGGGDAASNFLHGDDQACGVVDAEGLISYVNSLNGVIGDEYAAPKGNITIK